MASQEFAGSDQQGVSAAEPSDRSWNEASSERTFLDLQQAIGNRAARSTLGANLLQPKLRTSPPDDRFEHEAERTADAVMRMPDGVASVAQVGRIPAGQAQRMCAECAKEEDETVRRQPLEEEKELVQPISVVGAPAAHPNADVESCIGNLRGGGQPLPPAARSFFEPRFQHDFSDVRFHTGTSATAAARSINARAFTLGRDIVFGSGEYSPESRSGRRLLAHELTHVIQQETGRICGVQRAPADCAKKKLDDVEADVKAAVAAATADQKALPELYLALKRARACFSSFDEAAFLALIPASTTIFPEDLKKSIQKGHSKAAKADDRKLAWAESLKPFAGYLVSGFDTANRLLTGANRRRLGATMAPAHKPWGEFADKQNEATRRPDAQAAFSQATVLVFSGHQYAQYKLPGVWNTGNWDKTLDVRGIKGPLDNVKLVISTSCATLCTEAYEVWKGLFPKAIFLGAARSTPLKGSTLANSFVEKLPKDLLFDPGAPGLSGAIDAWKSAVKSTQTSAVRGGVLDVSAGTVELWNGKSWQNLSATDPENACRVKGDYSPDVPDPRGP